jgi:TPR repeat protein
MRRLSLQSGLWSRRTRYRKLVGLLRKETQTLSTDLGDAYYEAEGVPQDHAEAAKWYAQGC